LSEELASKISNFWREKNYFAKRVLQSKFFSRQNFFCSEKLPFSKIQKKNGGKKMNKISISNFFRQQVPDLTLSSKIHRALAHPTLHLTINFD
jgi:hypothetical protein